MLGAKQDSVALTPYQPSWQYHFQIEVIALRRALKSPDLKVEHIGSTAIPNISAKAVLDMLVSIDSKIEALDLAGDLTEALAVLDYRCIANDATCKIFVKEKDGVVTHNLKFTSPESGQWQDAVEFRDRMRSYPQWAERYELEKQRLAKRFPVNQSDYVRARANFIESILTTPTF